ncbi:MAG: 6,7-dimethyl-8-ribityllumazine synthase [Chloroflexota bacterium]|nr:6,7-dimethyl-8-ribityllumazine synthase [Chloroflexota bacterium]MDE2941108.1 6,7-dimethyl-8-ribityllumazine synthase [Chloroflexota bacterium]MDE3267366.1 6,7-dimethyl-8-ribityllumazine synthase [Chloroflexota bacterium]
MSGGLDAQGLRIGVVAARFNRFVTSRLVEGACEALLTHGLREDDLTVCWVPGSFEVPLAAAEMARTGRWDALVCLGAVIKGETAHFEYVAGEAARGVAEASRDTGVPMAFGIQTTYTEEQALARAGGDAGNRGYDAALSAIEMANLLRKLREESG